MFDLRCAPVSASYAIPRDDPRRELGDNTRPSTRGHSYRATGQKCPSEPHREDASGVTVEIANDLPAIVALEQEWSELERCTPEATGFQSFWWCHAWIISSASDRCVAAQPHVIVVRDGGRLVWLLPLQVEKRFGIRWARGLGQPVTPYADALALPSPKRAIWRAAADEALRRLGAVDVVAMIQVRADSVLAKLPGMSIVRRASYSAPFLDLGNADTVAGALMVGRTQRRRHRSLERTGPVCMEVVADSHIALSAIPHVLGLKRDQLRARRVHNSSLVTPVACRFLEMLARHGHIEVCQLHVGSHTAAIDLGFVAGDTYRSLLSVYDARFAHGSPGHALTRSLIEHCHARGLRTFDVLAPNEGYKTAISSGAIDIVSVHAPLTRRGRLGMAASLKLRRPFYAVRRWRDECLFMLQGSWPLQIFKTVRALIPFSRPAALLRPR